LGEWREYMWMWDEHSFIVSYFWQ